MSNDNRPIDRAERDRRWEATADSHGGVEVLDADRPRVAGEPNITHQTTRDPYTPGPMDLERGTSSDPTDQRGVNPRPMDRPATGPTPYPAPGQAQVAANRGRYSWSTLLTAIAVVLVVILLLSWLL